MHKAIIKTIMNNKIIYLSIYLSKQTRGKNSTKSFRYTFHKVFQNEITLPQ